MPRRQLRIRVRLHVLVDVRLSREVGRVAPDVLLSLRLVHTHIIDAHCRRESEQVEVDRAEGVRDTQVDDHVL